MIFNVWGTIEGTLIGIFSLRSTGQTIADTMIQGSFWFLAEFWYLLGLLYSYSHKLYIQNDDNMGHFFVFMI